MPNDRSLLSALDAVAEYEQLRIQLCRLIQVPLSLFINLSSHSHSSSLLSLIAPCCTPSTHLPHYLDSRADFSTKTILLTW